MIVVRLTGGLGNQLFQYAMGRYHSLRHSVELVLEDSFYIDPPADSTPRQYDLDKYPIVARRSNAEERHAWRSYTGRISKRFRRFVDFPGPFIYVHERPGQFNSNVNELGDGIFLDGYWQSERYFPGIQASLYADFLPLLPMLSEDTRISAIMKARQSISLHIRRGDYVSNIAANTIHGVCGLDYYDRAIRYMVERQTDPVFFIFSDDMQWVKKNLVINYPHVFVEHNSSTKAFQDLRLMSQCNHHILANSSFSWWGAWLNPSAEKLIVRPRTWFVGLPQTSTWACPEEWAAI